MLSSCDALLAPLDRIDVHITARQAPSDSRPPVDGNEELPQPPSKPKDPETHQPPSLSNAVFTINGALITNVAVQLNVDFADDNIDVSSLQFSWRLEDGPGLATFSTVNESSTTVAFDTDGSYTLSVEVQDQSSVRKSAHVSIIWDTTAPPPLANFTAIASKTVGLVDMSIELPVDTSDVDTIIVRRKLAAIPADCSDGDEAVHFKSSELIDSSDYSDNPKHAGYAYGYRACLTDLAGNITQVDTIAPITTKPHIIFASSTIVAGNLGGDSGSAHERADRICKDLASPSNSPLTAVANEPNWRAIISTSTLDARDHIVVTGLVSSADLVFDIADGHDELFSGALINEVFADERNGTVLQPVWTGSTSTGVYAGANCNDWTSEFSSDTGQTGNAQVSNEAWLEDSNLPCNQTHTIYCISQQ